MINLIFGLLTTAGYMALSFTFARCAYRNEYNLIYGSPAPQVYGGKHGHGKAHEVAVREAVWWLIMWPFFMSWAGIDWLITHGIQQGWVETANKISRMQEDVDRLNAKQDPLAGLDRVIGSESVSHSVPDPCPCGYTTECVIHCGDGSNCHEMMNRTRDSLESGAVIRTMHPEMIIPVTRHPNAAYLPGQGWVRATGADCQCSKCRSEKYPKIGMRYER